MLDWIIYLLKRFTRGLRNLVRRVRSSPDFVVLELEGDYPELTPPGGPWWRRLLTPPEPSLRDLRDALERVRRDRGVKGVVMHLRGLDLPMARAQSLRAMVEETRGTGKRVVAYAARYTPSAYHVASACDEILLQPGGGVDPLGLRQGFVFLAEALERAGLRADFLTSSAYKAGLDPLTRREMSPEQREMMDRLLDDRYDQLLAEVAEGRGIDVDEARTLVDGSPYTDAAALEAGAVDAIVGEDDLPEHLGADSPATPASWSRATGRLPLARPRRPGRYVALLRIEGDMVDGESTRPPRKPPVRVPFVGGDRAGDRTVVREVRTALRDPRAAAVVVHVDSGGGSSTAAEAMTGALRRLAREKPLVAHLGHLAGSGGYYVATPAHRVVARPGTITGSIGVIVGKIVGGPLLERAGVNREVLARGEHATILDPGEPFTEQERARMQELLDRTYEVFVDRVSEGRGLDRDAVDALGQGRIWTGREAVGNGLVDELGGLEDAIEGARELAGLGPGAPAREVVVLDGGSAPPATPAAKLKDALEDLEPLLEARPLTRVPFVTRGWP